MITKSDDSIRYKRQVENGINGVCLFAQNDGEENIANRLTTEEFAVEKVWLTKDGVVNESGNGRPGVRFRLLSREEKVERAPEPEKEKAPAAPEQGEFDLPEEVKAAVQKKAILNEQKKKAISRASSKKIDE